MVNMVIGLQVHRYDGAVGRKTFVVDCPPWPNPRPFERGGVSNIFLDWFEVFVSGNLDTGATDRDRGLPRIALILEPGNRKYGYQLKLFSSSI
jgi:hypothetical protein